jgi:hypothetical protein
MRVFDMQNQSEDTLRSTKCYSSSCNTVGYAARAPGCFQPSLDGQVNLKDGPDVRLHVLWEEIVYYSYLPLYTSWQK